MVDHSLVFRILLQIEVRGSVTASLPVWTNSAVMLSTPADFLIFSAAPALPVEQGGALHLVSVGSQVRLSHSCKGLNSTLSVKEYMLLCETFAGLVWL